MADTDKSDTPEWDAMIETVMDLMPAKLSNSEWRAVRDNIHTAIWAYVRDIFDESSIAFRKSSDGKSELLFG